MANYVPSHFAICVRSLERSLRFYCDGLGFEPVGRYELKGAELPGLAQNLEVSGDVELTTQVIERDGWRIELLQFGAPGVVGSPSAHRNQLGITHFAVSVDDVGAAAERMLEYGALVLDETHANFGTDVVFLMDPDGVRVALVRGIPPPAADA